MRLSRVLGTSATAGLLVALVFWLSCGTRLEYGVYAGGDSWYRDKFTLCGTLLAAAIVSLAVALLAAAVLWIVGKTRSSLTEPQRIRRIEPIPPRERARIAVWLSPKLIPC